MRGRLGRLVVAREGLRLRADRRLERQRAQQAVCLQACIWSEPMTDRAVFDRLVFPRLSAIAETGWSSNAISTASRRWSA